MWRGDVRMRKRNPLEVCAAPALQERLARRALYARPRRSWAMVGASGAIWCEAASLRQLRTWCICVLCVCCAACVLEPARARAGPWRPSALRSESDHTRVVPGPRPRAQFAQFRNLCRERKIFLSSYRFRRQRCVWRAVTSRHRVNAPPRRVARSAHWSVGRSAASPSNTISQNVARRP